MESLYSGSSRIDHHHVPFRVADNLEDMGMAADEYVRTVFFDELHRPLVITSGIASDMGHQDLHPLAFEKSVERVDKAEIMVVTIACDAEKRLEPGDFFSELQPPSEIPGMPYLIDRRQKFTELSVEYTMGIRYETYIHYKLIIIFFL